MPGSLTMSIYYLNLVKKRISTFYGDLEVERIDIQLSY